ncbi:zinc ABC transporter substrate-binding protein [Solirubrobacter sp. CPCC 204708]|uniref:Metal ABC transporter substrate-binding protein n=2 Tax=Solirubrobacter deserti TaxID=2282478 RepID=A0ABT4RVX2_9ACTN|nr:zinc ABC transporter substrate-binding protein [Solirubrobacter deserti]MDA0142401.1 metal ABC transporter substrate-binding protein [Solirubrobacter deserti]
MRVLLVLGLAVLAGCGSSSSGGDAGGLRVVATTTQLADMARNLDPSADVTALLSANTDPHAYEVRPDDVKALADADFVLKSGGETDEWLDGALESAGVADDKVIDAGAAAGLEGDDPHWWQDPRRAVSAAAAIGQGLAVDPLRYVQRLQALDRDVQACIDAVPEEERLLVTSHDALGYYARRYGIRVVGTVIPSLSTSGQPSAGEVDALVQTIRETGVKTIFAESSVNAKVEQAIASEAGVKVGKELWADSLGPEGSDGATYIGSIEANTRALVEGFTGKPANCF